MQKLKHALVTGGAGFIGSHLVEELVAGGCRVTVLDNLSTGHRRNIDHLGERESILAFQAAWTYVLIVFMMGLVAEQIALLRRERRDE